MKHKLIAFLLAIASRQAFSQVNTDWYGSITRNGNTSLVNIHISQNDKSKTTVDLPAQNKFGIGISLQQIDNRKIFIVMAEEQIAIDVEINSEENKLTGEVVYGGRSFPAVFSKNKIDSVSKQAPSPRSIGESGLAPDVNTKRSVEKINSVFIEELTWIDIRDAMREGKNTVIIATGGTEQSGPYVATGKHNFILKVTTDSIARRLGNALVAPIVPFVPEGNFDPPTQHLKYPGTISVREETYELLLKDIATSYKVEGFTNIIFLGDSGGNQWGMYLVARQLNESWQSQGVHVIFVPEYYDNTKIAKWLESQGIKEVSEGIHDSFKVTAQLSVLNPQLVRTAQRIKAGNYSINGVNLLSVEKTIEWGKKIISFQTSITVEAIKKKLGEN